MYTSKSDYRFLKAETQVEWDEDQMAHDKVLWRTIWSLQVPNKIKNLVWRACRNLLPTKENLVRRTIIENPTYDRCKHEPKSALHALWNCSKLVVVWGRRTISALQKMTHLCGPQGIALMAHHKGSQFGAVCNVGVANSDPKEPGVCEPTKLRCPSDSVSRKGACS